MMDNVDLGWHVAQGRWMVQHLAIYRHDALNYPNLGHPVMDEYPLFQVVLYAAWSLGWWGPCLFTATGLCAARGHLAVRRKGLPSASGLGLGLRGVIGLMLLSSRSSFRLRPHLATYLGDRRIRRLSAAPSRGDKLGPTSGRWRCCKSRGPIATAPSSSARRWSVFSARK